LRRVNPPQNEFLAGLKAESPILIGVIPFGMIYGVLALAAGIPTGATQAMSAIVFAGSSQVVITQLVGQNTPGLVIVLTATVINLRHLLYSASVSPYLQKLSTSWKLLLAYLLTDEAYAVSIMHFQEESPPTASYDASIDVNLKEPADNQNLHWYLLGAGLALWSTWQLSTAAGILLGAIIPTSWSLDFTLALTFIALVVPYLKDKPSILTALVSGFTALLAINSPYKLGILVAALAGIIIGVISEGKR